MQEQTDDLIAYHRFERIAFNAFLTGDQPHSEVLYNDSRIDVRPVTWSIDASRAKSLRSSPVQQRDRSERPAATYRRMLPMSSIAAKKRTGCCEATIATMRQSGE
jgi:hypothetical protein